MPAARPPPRTTMSRLAQHLLLAVALSALALTARVLTQLPWATLAVLLGAGVVAQGFAAWRPAPPAVYGLSQPSRWALAGGWVLRALIGSALLCALLAAGLWGLGAAGAAPDWHAAVAASRQWLTGFL